MSTAAEQAAQAQQAQMQQLVTGIADAMTRSLTSAFTPMLAEMTKVVTQGAINANPTRGLVDTRGMGRPPSFSGDEKSWREWRGKVTAYLYAADPLAKEALERAEVNNTPITPATLESDHEIANSERAIAFSSKLYLVLVDTCKGEPYRIVESAGYGNGLEAWRLLMRRYASRTPGTKRALLQSLFSLKPASSSESFETVLLTMEEMTRRYDAMTATAMSEDIKCAILVAVCPRELREYLDMSTDEFVYLDLRAKAMTWIERKRDQLPRNLQQMEARNSGHPVPMDVSAATHVYDEWASWSEWQSDESELQGVQDWGGHPSSEDQTWQETELTPEEVQYLHQWTKGKGSKGKGKPGKGPWTAQLPFKGKGGAKGGKSSKGGSKGDGKGKSGYNGECHWCGKWGHTAKFCRSKDAYMNEVRRAQGLSAAVEEPTVPSAAAAGLHGLEASGQRTVSWDLNTVLVSRAAQTSGAPSALKLPGVSVSRVPVASNRFAPLAEEEGDEGEGSLQRIQFPALAVVPKPVRESAKKWVRRRQSQSPQPGDFLHELCGCESALCNCENVKSIDLTIDSGAAEHVVGPKDLPHLPILPSNASATYIMANGHQTTNQGLQKVAAKTSHGESVNFRAQVTDVRRPLMSVSRICDGGHRVVFEASGGYIESLENGDRIAIRRDHNVYRLRVDIPGEEGFVRPGQ